MSPEAWNTTTLICSLSYRRSKDLEVLFGLLEKSMPTTKHNSSRDHSQCYQADMVNAHSQIAELSTSVAIMTRMDEVSIQLWSS